MLIDRAFTAPSFRLFFCSPYTPSHGGSPLFLPIHSQAQQYAFYGGVCTCAISWLTYEASLPLYFLKKVVRLLWYGWFYCCCRCVAGTHKWRFLSLLRSFFTAILSHSRRVSRPPVVRRNTKRDVLQQRKVGGEGGGG